MSDTCFRCHGPDQRSRLAGLRLDIRDEALKKTATGAVPIVPGDPGASAVVQRIFAAEPARRMPPLYSHKTLTAEQASGFRAQMAQLNDTQLSFEMYGRVVEAQAGLFEPNREALRHELGYVSAYLRRVLLEWETDPTVVSAGADASRLVGWKHFTEFVAYDDASAQAFRNGVAEPLTRIELLLMRSGAPPSEAVDRSAPD